MRKGLMYVILLTIGSAVLISGCKKDKEDPLDADVSSASDNSFAESTFDDIANIADQAGDNDSLSTYRSGDTDVRLLSTCATVTKDTTVVPHTITINFGTTNCLCVDNKNRRGKIIISNTGQYRDSAGSHSIIFDNYYVNDNKVEGTKTIVNKGHNSSGNLWFQITVNGVITNTSAQTLTWNSNRTREWINGENTFNLSDDVYRLAGTASGTSFTGISYTAAITSPLVVALNCRWVKQGVIAFTPAGKATRTLDYGNGTCDNNATVSINGMTYNITLK